MNLVIFEDHPTSQIKVCNIILDDLGENKTIFSLRHDRITRPPLLDWNLAIVSLKEPHNVRAQNVEQELYLNVQFWELSV